MSYLVHPYADLFPMMDRKGLAGLIADITRHGLREPITIYQGKVLDGRHRSIACSNAKIEPDTVEFEGTDQEALAFVISKNLHRRHLDVSQRSMIATELANLEHGQRADKVDTQNCASTAITQEQAAEMMNVSKRSVQNAKKVNDSGDAALIGKVKRGELSVSAAAKQVPASGEKKKPASKTEKKNDAAGEADKLMNLWNRTSPDGQKTFLDRLGATI